MDEVSSHVCLVLPSTDGKAARKIVPPRLRIPYWKGLGADSEEKHEPVSDIDTVVVDSLKALDPKRPIREADIAQRSRHVRLVPAAEVAVLIGQPDAHDVDSKLQASRGDKKETARSTWSLAERASRLVRMATGRSSSRRHI